MAKNTTQRLLVVGDAHFEPGQNLDRAAALGNAILEERPAGVVLMGDWVSMNSLSSYDKKGGLVLEGTRIKEDVAVGGEALELVVGPARRWSKRQSRHKHATWMPPIHYIEGNHEYRIVKWWKDDAQMQGTYALPEEFSPWITTYTVYGSVLWLRDVGFTHVPFNKVGPIASSGMTTSIAQKAALQSAKSVFFGHTHLLDLGHSMRLGQAQTVYGVNVGCYFEPEHDPLYMENRIKDWWRGVVWVDLAPNGEFDIQTVGINHFKSRYL